MLHVTVLILSQSFPILLECTHAKYYSLAVTILLHAICYETTVIPHSSYRLPITTHPVLFTYQLLINYIIYLFTGVMTYVS